jgi:hypothetical protein
VEERLPILTQFRNSWASAFLVKEAFAGRKAYTLSKKTETSYRMRRQRELFEKRRERMDLDKHGSDMEGDEDSGSRSPSPFEDNETDEEMLED